MDTSAIHQISWTNVETFATGWQKEEDGIKVYVQQMWQGYYSCTCKSVFCRNLLFHFTSLCSGLLQKDLLLKEGEVWLKFFLT